MFPQLSTQSSVPDHDGDVDPHHSTTVTSDRNSSSNDARSGSRLPTVSLVIPTLNEALNLPLVLAAVPECVTEIIVVDGRSTDATIAVALSWPRVRVEREPRAGKGFALSAGFAAASCDIVVMMDADGSMDPAEIPSFVRALVAGADVAKGSRRMHGGDSSDLTPLRSCGNAALTTTVNLLFGSRYTDLCYGYMAFWRDVVPMIDPGCPGFEVETLINIRAQQAQLEVAEVPSQESNRLNGTSNLSVWRDGCRIGRAILKGRTTRAHRPATNSSASMAV